PSHQSQPAKPERGFSAENQLSSSTLPSESESAPWLNAYGRGPAAAGRQGSSAANAPASIRHRAALRAKERSATLMKDPPSCVCTNGRSPKLCCASRCRAILSMCGKGVGVTALPHRAAAAPDVSAPGPCPCTMLRERGTDVDKRGAARSGAHRSRTRSEERRVGKGRRDGGGTYR